MRCSASWRAPRWLGVFVILQRNGRRCLDAHNKSSGARRGVAGKYAQAHQAGDAGIEFIPENGGGGIRLKKPSIWHGRAFCAPFPFSDRATSLGSLSLALCLSDSSPPFYNMAQSTGDLTNDRWNASTYSEYHVARALPCWRIRPAATSSCSRRAPAALPRPPVSPAHGPTEPRGHPSAA